jgi:anti-sigma B factor antagonist
MTKTEPSILPLEGEIDLHVSPQIRVSLATLIAKKPAHLVVDLSQVSYIDSSGLAVLIEAMQNVGSYGGKFALSGLQESVRPIFEIARLPYLDYNPADRDGRHGAALCGGRRFGGAGRYRRPSRHCHSRIHRQDRRDLHRHFRRRRQ